MAGLSVGVVAFGIIYGAFRFYDYEMTEFPMAIGAIVLLSTFMGLISYKRAAHKHRRAVEKELTGSGADGNGIEDRA